MSLFNPIAAEAKRATAREQKRISSGQAAEEGRIEADKAAAQSFRTFSGQQQAQMQQLGGQLAGIAGGDARIAAMRRAMAAQGAEAAAAGRSQAMAAAKGIEEQRRQSAAAAGERQLDRTRETAQLVVSEASKAADRKAKALEGAVEVATGTG